IGALGLCDRNGLYGAVTFMAAARDAGIHPIIGAELDLTDGSRLRFLARDRTGYRQLCRTISIAQLAGAKGQPRLHISGLTGDPPKDGDAVVEPGALNACTVLAGGPQSCLTRALLAGERHAAARGADRLRECFGRDRVMLVLTHHQHPADSWVAAETAALGKRTGLALVASSLPVHALRGDKPLLDVLTAIRHRTTLDDAAARGLLLANREHRIRSGAELRALLEEYPEAFDTTAWLATQCRVSLDFSDVRFPGFPVPRGETPFSVLYRICQEAVQARYHPVTREVAARLQRELDVIEKTGLAEFFLITWDIMRYAREKGIPGQGRGSAADSIVAYLCGITRVDPVAHDLLFERFLHEDHQGTPDIDIDFSSDHREQVLRYVYDKYGEERTGMVANVVTFRPRLAIRQVGAAMGFPETIIDRLAKSVDGWFGGDVADALEVAGLSAHSQATALPWRQFIELVGQIEGMPRHLSIHVGGMLVTGEPLIDVVPVERATMPGRVVVQFNKDDVEDLGLIKMDLLGLRTLSAVAECLDLIEQTTGSRPDLDTLALDDERVYDMICAPDTIGLFQVESRAQLQSLHQSQPRNFNDLIVQVAIIRPGPIQGDAVHPYLRRRQGLEPVTYLHPKLEPILSETRGVVLFQEQILRIVMEVAGYGAGEADRFRRAMNRHRSHVEMAELRGDFVRRCGEHGVDSTIAETIFKSVAGFAQFGFCKSHAAAFARTAYETAWLRLHHPVEYLCALLNAQPMGFYHPSVLVEDGKRHGVRTLPVDVRRSRARCTVEMVSDDPRGATVGEVAAERAVHAACRAVGVGGRRSGRRPSPTLGAPLHGHAVRLGFNYVRDLGEVGRGACEEAVRAEANRSVAAFWRHTRLPRRAMENLVMVGAFDGLVPGRPRRELLWELKAIEETAPGDLVELSAPAPPLTAMDERTRVATEYSLCEVGTGPHAVSFLRSHLDSLGCTPLARVAECADGSRLRVAGLVIARQAPSSGKGFRFFTLADEGGHLDLVFRPQVARRTRSVANLNPMLMVDGRLQADGSRLNLVVEQVAAVESPTAAVPASHDFH
ncbi:MAG: DNA polymerase III subunit alpha, partial [Candidatus Dormibacteria bacterium]